MKFIIGIDNGVSGAVAILNEKRELVNIIDAPTMREKRAKGTRERFDEVGMLEALKPYAKTKFLSVADQPKSLVVETDYVMAYLEEAHPLPIKAHGTPSSNFMMGLSSGLWKAFLLSLGIPFEEVKSKTWQKHFLEGVQGHDALKKKSVEVAVRLFPDDRPKLQGPRGGYRDGKTDALLIALYGLRREGQPVEPVEPEVETSVSHELQNEQ